MKKRKIIISSLITVMVLIGSFIILFYIFGSLEKENSLNPRFLEWFNSTSKVYYFDHPSVKCILEKTCNGVFQFEISVSEKNLSSLEKQLIKYGNITDEHSNSLSYSISFETSNPDKINNFFNLIQEINFINIKSNYKINLSLTDLKKCQIDKDCTLVPSGCCGCNYESINKNYGLSWQNQFYCLTSGCLALACISDEKAICEQNICTKRDITSCNYNTDCISGEEDCINSALASRLSYETTERFNCKCEQNKCIGIPKKPIIINITSPLNNSIIGLEEIYFNATTNRDSTCEYSLKIKKGEIITEIGFREMNQTGKRNHSQLFSSLKNRGSYILQLECDDLSGNIGKNSVNFLPTIKEFLNFSGGFIGGITPIPHSSFTGAELPILLKDDLFNYSNSFNIPYTTLLSIHSKNIENSTGEGNLESPKPLILIGTDYNNYLYKYSLIFSRNINFTKNDNEEFEIELLGEKYKIIPGSTNQKLILKNDYLANNFILENNQPLMINNQVINGTYIKFNAFLGSTSVDYINQIDFYFAMQNSSKDYLLAGESYVNPLFQNIKYSFKTYSQENGAEIYFGQFE